MAKLGISTGTVPNDGSGDTLLSGAVKINSNFSEIYTYFGDGTNLGFTSGKWATTSSGIHTLSKVGIGTTNPRFALEVGAVGASGTTLYVNGDARVTGILTIGTSSITLNGSSNIVNVGTGITINGSTGIISATSIVVGGTTLTGAAVTRIEAGSGISIDQNTGQVTITATGGGGTTGAGTTWAVTNVGIYTTKNVGIGTTNPTSALTIQGNVTVSGVSTFSNTIVVGTGKSLTFGDAGANYLKLYSDGSNTYINQSNVGKLIIDASGTQRTLEITDSQASQTMAKFLGNGGAVELYHNNTKRIETTGAGVTVTGTTFTNQLNVSGVSTFDGRINASASGILFDTSSYTGSDEPIKLWVGDSGGARYFTLLRSNGGQVIFNNAYPTTGHNDHRAPTHSFTQTGSDYYALFNSGSVKLYHPGSASGILDQKLETTSTGVSVSGIVTAISGIVTYYGDTSNAVDGRWILGADGTSNYTFTGIGFTQTTNDPVLYLARGRVYEFVNNSGGSHPFQIRVGNGGAAYSNGVTNNGSASGTIRFEVPFSAPNTLYYQCTNHSGMGATIFVTPRNEPAVGVRTTVTATTGSVGAGDTTNLNIDGFKTYSLLKVGITSAAWVVLYTDATSRTNDASRSYLTDPTPGSGIIAEVRSTSAGISTFIMSPGVIGWNNDVSVASTIYARVTNNESSTSAGIGVTLTVVKLED